METLQQKRQRMQKGKFTPAEIIAGWKKCDCGAVVSNYGKHKKKCPLLIKRSTANGKGKSYDKDYYRRLKGITSPDGNHSLTRGPKVDVNPLEE